MLTHWKRAGRFAEPAGVIIGTLENIRNNGSPDEAAVSALLDEHFGGAPYPVVRDWPSGHGVRNRALPLGTRVSIDASRAVVRFEERAVA
jgi:muramoyltetrapeptide carboxypeptidase